MPNPADIGVAIEELVATKSEHRPIIATIAGDTGMAPSTRKALLDHLMAEEDERVAAIASAAGSAARPTGDATPVRGLTVGSLRGEPAPISPTRLGSLRPR